jgi:hypothetical protein
MVSKEQCMKMILEYFPKFQEKWQEHLDWWEGESAGLCNDMAEFSHYIRDLILRKDNKNEEAIKLAFILIERLMVEGTEEVQTAAATCFLENLINAVSWERISAESFVHLLGKESKAYCRAWDEFTGVKTEGLWIDEEI